MAYKVYQPQYDWSWLDKQQTQPKTATGKTSIARQAYIKTLGFTPKDMPEFRSERPKPKGVMKVFDFLDRGRSGVLAGMNQMMSEDIAKSRKTGRSMGSVNAERTLKNIGPLGLRNLKYLPTMIEGAKSDTNFTGKSLVSRYYDDPHIRKQITPGQAKIVDNKAYRGAMGFAADVLADPTNLIPVGTMMKPVKYASKVTGLTDNVVVPAVKAIKASGPALTIGKKIGAFTPKVIKEAASNRNVVQAMGSEIENVTSKLLTKGLSKRDIYKGEALIKGVLTRTGNKAEVGRAIKDYNNVINKANKAVKTLMGSGGIDQELVLKVARGAARGVYAKEYDDIAKALRYLQDDVATLVTKSSRILDEATIASNVGKYHRKYYKGGGVEDIYEQVGRAKKGSKGFGSEIGATKMAINDPQRVFEYLKKYQRDVPEIQDIIQKYNHEVRKYTPEVNRLNPKEIKGMPSISLAARNEAAKKFEPELRKLLGDKFDSFAFAAQKKAGMITDASKVFPSSIGQGIELGANQNFLNVVGGFTKEFADEATAIANKYRKVPNTDKFGPIAGKYIPENFYDDIVGIVDPTNSEWKKIINAWKQLKLFAPLNFASISRNFLSDMVMNSLVEGGPSIMTQMLYMPKIIKDYAEGGPLYREVTESGLIASTFANQEARKLLGREIAERPVTFADNIGRATDKFVGFGKGREMYSGVSDIGKMMQVFWQKKKGKSLEEAVQFANKATFDYSALPPGLTGIRDNLMPFMTYKYFAAQLVWDTFINRTGKITKLTHARRAVEGLSEDKANDRDLPQYMKDNRAFYFRLPGQFNDEQENPRYLDMSYLLPMGDLGGTSPKDLVFGNPFVKTGVEFATNKSMFNDMPIVQDTDMPTEKAKKYALYLATQFGPSAPWMPNNQGDIKLLDAARGKVNSQGNKMSLTYEAPARLAGIRTQEVNPKLQRKYNGYDKKDQITELNSKIRKVKKSDDDLETKKKKIARLKQQIKDIKNN